MVEFVGEKALALGGRLLLRDVADLDDRTDNARFVVADGTGGEPDRVEMSVFMNEHLLAALLIVLRKGPVDGAFRERKGAAIRVGVVDDIVQGAIAREDFGQAETGEQFRSPVHVDAVLAVIHQEDGHRSVVQDRVESPLRLIQL